MNVNSALHKPSFISVKLSLMPDHFRNRMGFQLLDQSDKMFYKNNVNISFHYRVLLKATFTDQSTIHTLSPVNWQNLLILNKLIL